MSLFSKKPKIWLVSDGSDTLVQSRELAQNLGNQKYISEFNKLSANSQFSYPDYAIGVGYKIADDLISIKERSKNKTKIITILDPLKDYEKFDFIILPSYEPYNIKAENIIYSRGLINYVNKSFLKREANNKKYDFIKKLNLAKPFTTLIIGGKHTGGNIDEEDAFYLAKRLNKIIAKKDGTLLISSSRRTEDLTIKTLIKNLNIPFYFYNYNLRQIENPYNYFLAISDEIIVTGDSVRMMSEAVSSGKNVRIYSPKKLGFQYYPLINEFLENNNAVNLEDEFFDNNLYKTLPINEAERIAKLILNKNLNK